MTQSMKQPLKKLSNQENLTRSLAMEVANIDDENRRMELSFSSEAVYRRWFGNEILSHTKESVNLERLNETGCVLFNHNRDKVVGRIDKAWVADDGKCRALVTFDEDAESDIIYQKVKNKSLRGVSTGYTVNEWETVEANEVSVDGRHVGPAHIAVSWEPYEISIVSVPADTKVGVGRSQEKKQIANRSLLQAQIQINKNLLGVE